LIKKAKEIQTFTYDLSRFTEAHQSSYQTALSEIRNGKKQSHWMWYIFPQIIGLGKSEMAIKYSIKDIGEAKAFLSHPYLGKNLMEITRALLDLSSCDAPTVFSSDIDALKLKSSITLFLHASGHDSLFEDVLNKFFSGKQDLATLRILAIQNS
jgi:uncharacterized protein (DUF1810 family)